MNPTVYVEGGYSAYTNMFEANGWNTSDNLQDADLVQFIGGADVNPLMYGEQPHPQTWFDIRTDEQSVRLYERAKHLSKPMAGICRGSQFLCVRGGGKLWQDVDNHANGMGHSIRDIETDIIVEQCSSTHHQQHRPSDKAIIIAESFPTLSTVKSNVANEKVTDWIVGNGLQVEGCDIDFTLTGDVEAFYYPHINALGFQPHPEFFDADHPCQMYYFDIIAKYLNLKAGE